MYPFFFFFLTNFSNNRPNSFIACFKKIFCQTLADYMNLSEEMLNTLSKNSNTVASDYEIGQIRELWVGLLK